MTELTPIVDPKGHLLIAVLNYRPEYHHRVLDAIENAYWSLHIHRQWRVTRVLHQGNADICDSRNLLVSQFWFQEAYTHILCVDGDVSWAPGSVERLLSHDLDFVMGAYPKRGDNEGYPVKFLDQQVPVLVNPKTGDADPVGGLIKIAGGPGGFMLMSRAMVAKWVETFPDAWYYHPKVPGGKAIHLFEFAVINNRRHSEDMHFCRKWREMGGDVWCDPHIPLNHHGDKMYAGALIEELRLIGRPKNKSEKIIRVEA